MVRRDTATLLVWCVANLGVGLVFGALYMGHVSANWRNFIGLSMNTINVALFLGGVGAVVVACAEWATVLREVLAGVNGVGTILLSKAVYNTVSPTQGAPGCGMGEEKCVYEAYAIHTPVSHLCLHELAKQCRGTKMWGVML
jgi:hypothetical protein